MHTPPVLTLPDGMEFRAPGHPGNETILTREALQFVADLQQEFGSRRVSLLERRQQRQVALDSGEKPQFLTATAYIRNDPSWKVASTPPDLQKRWVEITGPTDRKMLINALNSGANIFMADFEDANSPTWQNMVEGQANLHQAIRRKITFTSPDGKQYRLNDQVAVLMVRPRGWHLVEKNVFLDSMPLSGSLFDFGLYFFHNARYLLENGSGPYFYLPKLENHLEARLWNDVFLFAQAKLGLPSGSIRATVLIETILAAFEMEEILYELREHSAGLNAGRWDYIFSIIKKFRKQPALLFPDRVQITMTTPFMRAYTELLVRTCHSRQAHAMGGMAAYIPSRKDPEVNERALSKVREDKLRESKDGFDGTWVAHPDLVPVAMEIFSQALGDKPNQKDRLRQEVSVSAADLVNFDIPNSQVTEAGLRLNINVGIQYIESWLRGTGAAAIHNLMEDAATAEISRAQVWQWIHHPGAVLSDGRKITAEMVHGMILEELSNIETQWGKQLFGQGRFALASQIFERLIGSDVFEDFLTQTAYEYL